MTWGDVFRFWTPDGQMWFFPWIVLATLLVALVEPWRGGARLTVLLGASAIVSLTLWGVGSVYAFIQGLPITPFFVLGAWFGAERFGRLSSRRAPAIATAAGGLVVWLVVSWFTNATVPTGEGFSRTAGTVSTGIVGCVAGTAGVLALASMLPRVGTGWLALCGRHSLEIFLAQIVAAAAVRVVLLRLGVTDVPVHALLGTLVGVAVPLALASVAENLGIGWLFRLPTPLQRRLASAAARLDGRLAR